MEWLSKCLEIPLDRLGACLDQPLEQCAASRRWVLVHDSLQKAGAKCPELIQLMDLSLNKILELHNTAQQRPPDERVVQGTPVTPLSEMQQSYAIGRQDATMGPCQIYTEAGCLRLKSERFELTPKHMCLSKHEHVKSTADRFKYGSEISNDCNFRVEEASDAMKGRCRWHRPLPKDHFWSLGVSRTGGSAVRLHVVVDMMFLDAQSWMMVFQEVAAKYDEELPQDQLAMTAQMRSGFLEHCSEASDLPVDDISEVETWLRNLPLGPALPWCKRQGRGQVQAFGRLSSRLEKQAWNMLKTLSREWKVQPTALLLTYFQDALGRNSIDAAFTLTATVSRRPANLQHSLGEFTNVALLASGVTREERNVRATEIQKKILEQIQLDRPSGMQLMRRDFACGFYVIARRGGALRSPEMKLTFADLYRATSNLTYRLSSFSKSPQESLPSRVAILMRKGWEQIVACLAVLKAGCCYVPLEQSDCRWRRVLKKAHCSSILIAEDVEVLALSNLNFDLSVYDIFGTLAAGATVVLPDQSKLHNYRDLCHVVQEQNITIWNSVPLRFQLLLREWDDKQFLPIRAALISGDCINTSFAQEAGLTNLRCLIAQQRFPQLRFIALGGATEASIWSNFHEFSERSPVDVPLVPYGRALPNQSIYVLDERQRVCPKHVVGEIYIGGLGVAKEYFDDREKTQKSFVEHTDLGRLYRTGDEGQYLSNSEIRILGRRDQQVKVNGFRVELGEIEQKAQEKLGDQEHAIVTAKKVGSDVELRGFLCLRQSDDSSKEAKQKAVQRQKLMDLADHRNGFLPDPQEPGRVLQALPPSRCMLPQEAERRLLSIARTLLQQDLDVKQNLVDAGMTSLKLIRFQQLIQEELGTHVPSHAVFDHPTIQSMAERYLVAPELTVDLMPMPAQVSNRSQARSVCGVAARLPCKLDQLGSGVNGLIPIPLTRFDVEEYEGIYARHGAFVQDIEAFDHSHFEIAHDEALAMEPQQRLALEAGRQALLGGGHQSLDVGVYVGQMNYDQMVATQAPAPYGSTGIAPSIIANKISFCHDLRGPSIAVDTACSASLVATDLAMNIAAALVVGAHVLLAPDMYLHACRARMLSPAGRCATFDRSADGFVRGEGVAAMFLALHTQGPVDRPYILGTSTNQHGTTAGLTKPSCEAQKALVRKGFHAAQVDGCDVLCHELHGTGTRLGDPLELEAVRATYGESARQHFDHTKP
eukprot:Skav228117  [mRNA]  locus=scaffold1220:95676:104037:+ [translate_table: standard]